MRAPVAWIFLLSLPGLGCSSSSPSGVAAAAASLSAGAAQEIQSINSSLGGNSVLSGSDLQTLQSAGLLADGDQQALNNFVQKP